MCVFPHTYPQMDWSHVSVTGQKTQHPAPWAAASTIMHSAVTFKRGLCRLSVLASVLAPPSIGDINPTKTWWGVKCCILLKML